MARTKQTTRKSTGGYEPRPPIREQCHRHRPPAGLCYYAGGGKEDHKPTSRSGRHSLRQDTHGQDRASSKIIANFKDAKDFPHFVKLPPEIQKIVWEMLAEEPRVVAVNTKTNSGLRSFIPSILHVCSESRDVGLKHYTLAFGSQPINQQRANHTINILPPRVYFNFERDTLYFRENWNKNVEGAWCCLSQFRKLVNENDLKRVRNVGLDVNARVCSLEKSGNYSHLANFALWDALEILYLGYEDARLGSDCLIRFSALESKDYKYYMQRYKMNPCWRHMRSLPQDVDEAVEYLRNEVPVMYHGNWKKPDWFLKKLELVSIKQL